MIGVLRRIARRAGAGAGADGGAGFGSDETGSTIPLLLGYIALGFAAVVVTVDITALHLEQRRLDAVADAAATAAADGFVLRVVDGAPTATLTARRVRAQAVDVIASGPDADRTSLISARSPDGRSAQIVVGRVWSPPLSGFLFPGGVDLRATGTARTALR